LARELSSSVAASRLREALPRHRSVRNSRSMLSHMFYTKAHVRPQPELTATLSRLYKLAPVSHGTDGNNRHCDQLPPTGGCEPCGLSLSKSACDVDVLVAVAIPNVFVDDGPGAELVVLAYWVWALTRWPCPCVT